jgi:monoamine oxidase
MESAEDFDLISVADFLKEKSGKISSAVIREFELLVQTVLACDPENISFLAFLNFVNACGGLRAVADGDGGAQTFKLANGSQQIPQQMTAELLKSDANVVLQSDTTVSKVDYEETDLTAGGDRKGCLKVWCGSEVVCSARCVILAISPVLWGRISFPESVLPRSKALNAARMVPGRAIKVVMTFEQEFWREEKCASQPRPALEECGPIANLFPSTVGHRPALVGLITGSDATTFSELPSDSHRRSALAAQLEAYFSISINTLSSLTVDVTVFNWTKEVLSGGCFAAVMPPGLATEAQRSVPRGSAADGVGDTEDFESLHLSSAVGLTKEGGGDDAGLLAFASTELGATWPGYFEGAIDSGYRAAAKVGNWLDANIVQDEATTAQKHSTPVRPTDCHRSKM